MIIQENDFLKTYNEIDKLWEETDPVNNRQTMFYFEEVVAAALKEGSPTQNNTTINTKYWCDLRYLLLNKSYSIGRTESKYWYTRFLSFYKAYKAELAILEWLKSLPEFSNCHFPNAEEQGALWPDKQEVTADIETAQGKVECKSCRTPSTVHDANLIVRHTSVKLDSDKIKVCLIGHKGTLKRIYKRAEVPGYAYELDSNFKLETKLSKLPAEFPVELTIPNMPVGLLEALQQIDIHLNSQKTALQDKATLILNKQTQALDKTTEKILAMFPGDSPDVTLPSSSVVDAAQTLETTATALYN